MLIAIIVLVLIIIGLTKLNKKLTKTEKLVDEVSTKKKKK